MKIYADVVFVINFIMDVFILWVAAVLAKKKTPFYRLTAGGFLMALLYCLLIFFTRFEAYLNIIIAAIILIFGIIVSFKIYDLKDLIKLIFLAYISSFAVGGIGMAIFYYININNLIGNITGVAVNNFSIKILLVSVSVSYILIKLFLRWYTKNIVKKQIFYRINIFYKNNCVHINALVDTGNSLCDPISKTPVIIAEFNSIKSFLSNEIRLIFYENRESDLTFITNETLDINFMSRIRMIPFVSLGEKNGMLIGFRPDKVEIIDEGKVNIINDTVIGIYNDKLCVNGTYQGLINPETTNII